MSSKFAKPRYRVALSHSMGLAIPDLDVACLKLLTEPVWADDAGRTGSGDLIIRCIDRVPQADAAN